MTVLSTSFFIMAFVLKACRFCDVFWRADQSSWFLSVCVSALPAVETKPVPEVKWAEPLPVDDEWSGLSKASPLMFPSNPRFSFSQNVWSSIAISNSVCNLIKKKKKLHACVRFCASLLTAMLLVVVLIDGMAVDSSSDWNAPSEEWANYEEPEPPAPAPPPEEPSSSPLTNATAAEAQVSHLHSLLHHHRPVLTTAVVKK